MCESRAAHRVHGRAHGKCGGDAAAGALPLGELSGAHHLPPLHPLRVRLEWRWLLLPGTGPEDVARFSVFSYRDV